MLSKLKIPLLTGLSFSGLSILTVRFFGFSQNSFMILAYLYIFLAVIIGIYYEVRKLSEGSILGNVLVVVEEEEKVVKKVFTGEKYKVKGEFERLQ